MAPSNLTPPKGARNLPGSGIPNKGPSPNLRSTPSAHASAKSTQMTRPGVRLLRRVPAAECGPTQKLGADWPSVEEGAVHFRREGSGPDAVAGDAPGGEFQGYGLGHAKQRGLA